MRVRDSRCAKRSGGRVLRRATSTLRGVSIVNLFLRVRVQRVFAICFARHGVQCVCGESCGIGAPGKPIQFCRMKLNCIGLLARLGKLECVWWLLIQCGPCLGVSLDCGRSSAVFDRVFVFLWESRECESIQTMAVTARARWLFLLLLACIFVSE